jgi:hypothetical protein
MHAGRHTQKFGFKKGKYFPNHIKIHLLLSIEKIKLKHTLEYSPRKKKAIIVSQYFIIRVCAHFPPPDIAGNYNKSLFIRFIVVNSKTVREPWSKNVPSVTALSKYFTCAKQQD